MARSLQLVVRALGASGILSALVRVSPVLGNAAQTQQHSAMPATTISGDMFDAMDSVIAKTVGGLVGSESPSGSVASSNAKKEPYQLANFTYPSANPHVQRDCAEPDPDVKSLLGSSLCACGVKGQSPKPGYFRNGFCQTDHSDFGSHILCGKSTTQFLDSQEKKNNPLRSVIRHDGDEWCFCAIRWRQGYCMGEAVPVVLEATSAEVLKSFRITKRMIDDANNPNNGGVTQRYDCEHTQL